MKLNSRATGSLHVLHEPPEHIPYEILWLFLVDLIILAERSAKDFYTCDISIINFIRNDL